MTSSRKILAYSQRLAAGLLNLTVHPLLSLVPRRRKQWAFGHQGGAFAGNGKYLYLWLSLHRPDIDICWITPDKRVQRTLEQAGYPARAKWSLAGLAYALRSSAHIFDHSVSDVNLLVSGGAKLINLWHGVGLKSTQFGDKGGVVSRHKKYEKNRVTRAFFLDYLQRPDIVVTTSPFMQAHFAEQFDLPEERCPQLGYPRLDIAADPLLKEAAVRLEMVPGWKTMHGSFTEHYIYLPTYRDTQRPFLSEAFPDLDRLSAVLKSRNAILYLKLHPRTADSIPDGYPNIRAWPVDLDFYAYLDDFDILMTDYSSVLYDYLFVRPKGAILYTFDMERYLKEDRSLLYPFAENVAGVCASSFKDLCDVLEDGKALVHSDEQISRIRDRFWSGSSAPASPNIVYYIERLTAPEVRAARVPSAARRRA